MAKADEQLWNLARYLIELPLIEQRMLIYKPSLLAASAMFLANRIIKKDQGIWTEDLIANTTYTESSLRSCAKDMCILIAGIEKCSLQTVRKKFSLTRYNQVATIKIEQ